MYVYAYGYTIAPFFAGVRGRVFFLHTGSPGAVMCDPPPAAFIGEFDEESGAKMTYVSELYGSVVGDCEIDPGIRAENFDTHWPGSPSKMEKKGEYEEDSSLTIPPLLFPFILHHFPSFTIPNRISGVKSCAQSSIAFSRFSSYGRNSPTRSSTPKDRCVSTTVFDSSAASFLPSSVPSIQPAGLTYACGTALIGKDVLTANGIRSEYQHFCQHVASRVLKETMGMQGEKKILFCEPGLPAVAGISFRLVDVQGRGSRRQFCVVFIHSSLRVLMSVWPALYAWTMPFIEQWEKHCTERSQGEHGTASHMARTDIGVKNTPTRATPVTGATSTSTSSTSCSGSAGGSGIGNDRNSKSSPNPYGISSPLQNNGRIGGEESGAFPALPPLRSLGLLLSPWRNFSKRCRTKEEQEMYGLWELHHVFSSLLRRAFGSSSSVLWSMPSHLSDGWRCDDYLRSGDEVRTEKDGKRSEAQHASEMFIEKRRHDDAETKGNEMIEGMMKCRGESLQEKEENKLECILGKTKCNFPNEGVLPFSIFSPSLSGSPCSDASVDILKTRCRRRKCSRSKWRKKRIAHSAEKIVLVLIESTIKNDEPIIKIPIALQDELRQTALHGGVGGGYNAPHNNTMNDSLHSSKGAPSSLFGPCATEYSPCSFSPSYAPSSLSSLPSSFPHDTHTASSTSSSSSSFASSFLLGWWILPYLLEAMERVTPTIATSTSSHVYHHPNRASGRSMMPCSQGMRDAAGPTLLPSSHSPSSGNLLDFPSLSSVTPCYCAYTPSSASSYQYRRESLLLFFTCVFIGVPIRIRSVVDMRWRNGARQRSCSKKNNNNCYYCCGGDCCCSHDHYQWKSMDRHAREEGVEKEKEGKLDGEEECSSSPCPKMEWESGDEWRRRGIKMGGEEEDVEAGGAAESPTSGRQNSWHIPSSDMVHFWLAVVRLFTPGLLTTCCCCDRRDDDGGDRCGAPHLLKEEVKSPPCKEFLLDGETEREENNYICSTSDDDEDGVEEEEEEQSKEADDNGMNPKKQKLILYVFVGSGRVVDISLISTPPESEGNAMGGRKLFSCRGSGGCCCASPPLKKEDQTMKRKTVEEIEKEEVKEAAPIKSEGSDKDWLFSSSFIAQQCLPPYLHAPSALAVKLVKVLEEFKEELLKTGMSWQGGPYYHSSPLNHHPLGGKPSSLLSSPAAPAPSSPSLIISEQASRATTSTGNTTIPYTAERVLHLLEGSNVEVENTSSAMVSVAALLYQMHLSLYAVIEEYKMKATSVVMDVWRRKRARTILEDSNFWYPTPCHYSNNNYYCTSFHELLSSLPSCRSRDSFLSFAFSQDALPSETQTCHFGEVKRKESSSSSSSAFVLRKNHCHHHPTSLLSPSPLFFCFSSPSSPTPLRWGNRTSPSDKEEKSEEERIISSGSIRRSTELVPAIDLCTCIFFGTYSSF